LESGVFHIWRAMARPGDGYALRLDSAAASADSRGPNQDEETMGQTSEPRVAFVTGAARGLGRATAEALAADGLSLFLVDVLAGPLEETRAELSARGAACEAKVVDVADRGQCIGAIEAALAAYGRLDVLCNVAGIVRFNHATEVPEAEWSRILAVNLSGPFFLCQAAIPHLIKTAGNIVNVCSQSALMGTPYIAPYSASKAGLLQLTKSLAMEYMDAPIRINAVAPGTMATPIGEGLAMPADLDWAKIMRYQGQRPASPPEDVAAMVAFVASPRAASVHGAVLSVDGGVTAG
jgi:NAD(P)-dependent dehydrogenase (short-subunit alcohol dehydrogenase family)